MTNQSGLEPEDLVRNRVTEDEDDLDVEGHRLNVGRAVDEPGAEGIRPRATEDDDLDVEGHKIRSS